MNSATDGRLARSQVSRAAILEAALTIISDLGVPALTHRAVATQAGVSHALVTYHFSTASHLRQATLTFATNRVGETLETLLAGSPDAKDVPHVAAELAQRLSSDMQRESRALFELMIAATREPDLRPVMSQFSEHLADLIQPLSGDRERALDASSAFLGRIFTSMALGTEQPAALAVAITRLIDYFDPSRDG